MDDRNDPLCIMLFGRVLFFFSFFFFPFVNATASVCVSACVSVCICMVSVWCL